MFPLRATKGTAEKGQSRRFLDIGNMSGRRGISEIGVRVDVI
jgi:hypothetical protein